MAQTELHLLAKFGTSDNGSAWKRCTWEGLPLSSQSNSWEFSLISLFVSIIFFLSRPVSFSRSCRSRSQQQGIVFRWWTNFHQRPLMSSQDWLYGMIYVRWDVNKRCIGINISGSPIYLFRSISVPHCCVNRSRVVRFSVFQLMGTTEKGQISWGTHCKRNSFLALLKQALRISMTHSRHLLSFTSFPLRITRCVTLVQ